MTHEPNTNVEPQGLPGYDALPTVAQVEVDRYCFGCGYNLRGQPVRREGRTRLWLTRCPECGRFHAAGDTATALQPWLNRVALLGVLAWALILAYLILLVGGAQIAISVVTVDEIAWFERRAANPRYQQYNSMTWEQDIRLIKWGMGALSGALGLASAMVWTVALPHWRRWGYALLVVALPVLGMLGLGATAWLDPSTAPPGSTAIVLAYTALHVLGGAAGVLLGRPLARLLATLLLSPRLRTAVSYLWRVDGKAPPSAADQAGRRGPG